MPGGGWQLFITLATKSGIEWRGNGLRHSFISYRLGVVKDVGQVALEPGNSPAMVFKNYRQFVTETAAKEWFGIVPAEQSAQIIPMPEAPTTGEAAHETNQGAGLATAVAV